MSILLDTHVFYWWITASDTLSERHREAISSETGDIYVSAVTAWEMAIKVKLGKWAGAVEILPILEQSILDEGFTNLDISVAHGKLAGSLDLTHRDPFDRLLAAQALTLDIPIATVDAALAQLGCKVI